MVLSRRNVFALVVVAFIGGLFAGNLGATRPAMAQAATHVYELRTYTAPPGKLAALKARFRDHTIRIFRKHNMRAMAYWTPQDAPLKDNTLIYVLEHASREAAVKNWDAFKIDPEWVKAKADSEKDGPLTTKTPDSVFMDPADFSPMK